MDDISQLKETVQSQLSGASNKTDYDFIVIGTGSMGSSACYHLAKQGHQVLGLEQFDIPHESGSHTGQSRIIRKAYFEHPNYVPLLERAYKNWQELEHQCGRRLYHKTGLLYFGPEDHFIIKGTQRSSKTYNLRLELLNAKEQKAQYPQFDIPDNYVHLREPDAGFLIPEIAILSFLEQALQNGATIRTQEKVLDWKQVSRGIQVTTNKNVYHCKKLIITVGAWTSNFTNLNNLDVTKQILAWADVDNEEAFQLDNLPCWNIADPEIEGILYGFPSLPPNEFEGPYGLKFAHHFKGKLTNPSNVNRKVSIEEQHKLADTVRKFIPDVKQIHTVKTCLYTCSPDEDFIIDHHSKSEDVIIAAGFSGHGFKFSSVIGEILSDLAIHGKTTQPIEFLNAKRFK